MKHLILFFTFLLFCNCQYYANQDIFTAKATVRSYAQIINDNVYLYRTATESEIVENKYYVIEKTYFVEILSVVNSIFYEARYRDTTGFVKIKEVQCVDGIPNVPHLENITFRVYGESSMTIRSAPSADYTTQICDMPKYSYIDYYGKIVGDAYTLNRTKIWYYGKFKNEDNQEFYGYVYSDNTDEMAHIIMNNEILPYLDEPSFITRNSQSLENNTKNVIIILLSIPTMIFVFMLVRSSAILYADKSAKQKSNRREISEF